MKKNINNKSFISDDFILLYLFLLYTIRSRSNFVITGREKISCTDFIRTFLHYLQLRLTRNIIINCTLPIPTVPVFGLRDDPS